MRGARCGFFRYIYNADGAVGRPIGSIGPIGLIGLIGSIGLIGLIGECGACRFAAGGTEPDDAGQRRKGLEMAGGEGAGRAGNGWQGSPRMAFASDEAGNCPGAEASAGDSSRAAPDAFAGGGVWVSTPFFRRVSFDGNPRGTNR